MSSGRLGWNAFLSKLRSTSRNDDEKCLALDLSKGKIDDIALLISERSRQVPNWNLHSFANGIVRTTSARMWNFQAYCDHSIWQMLESLNAHSVMYFRDSIQVTVCVSEWLNDCQLLVTISRPTRNHHWFRNRFRFIHGPNTQLAAEACVRCSMRPPKSHIIFFFFVSFIFSRKDIIELLRTRTAFNTAFVTGWINKCKRTIRECNVGVNV